MAIKVSWQRNPETDNFPKEIEFAVMGNELHASTSGKGWRMLDSWALARVAWLRRLGGLDIQKLYLRAPEPRNHQDRAAVEGMRRRASFLRLANAGRLDIVLLIGAATAVMSDAAELISPLPDERVNFGNDRSNDDQSGRLEKDLQCFFFGTGDGGVSGLRSAERLYLLGDDFRDLGKGKKNYPLDREYATGTFHGKVTDANRLTPTCYIDLISFTKRQNLAVIELKVNDPCLEVISQLLDYALFAARHKVAILENLAKRAREANLYAVPKGAHAKPVACFIGANVFHPKLVGDGMHPGIISYYQGAMADQFHLRLVQFGGAIGG